MRVAAEHTAPVVLRIQHVEQRKQTPKRVRKVTEYLVIAIKVLFITAPLVLVFCSQFTDKQILEFTTTLSIGLVLAAATILFFVLQFVVGRILVVPRQNVW